MVKTFILLYKYSLKRTRETVHGIFRKPSLRIQIYFEAFSMAFPRAILAFLKAVSE